MDNNNRIKEVRYTRKIYNFNLYILFNDGMLYNLDCNNKCKSSIPNVKDIYNFGFELGILFNDNTLTNNNMEVLRNDILLVSKSAINSIYTYNVCIDINKNMYEMVCILNKLYRWFYYTNGQISQFDGYAIVGNTIYVQENNKLIWTNPLHF